MCGLKMLRPQLCRKHVRNLHDSSEQISSQIEGKEHQKYMVAVPQKCVSIKWKRSHCDWLWQPLRGYATR